VILTSRYPSTRPGAPLGDRSLVAANYSRTALANRPFALVVACNWPIFLAVYKFLGGAVPIKFRLGGVNQIAAATPLGSRPGFHFTYLLSSLEFRLFA
jgi:hypothetical protein